MGPVEETATVSKGASVMTSSSDRLLAAEQTRDGPGAGAAPTFALEPVGGGGEQQSVGHGLGAAAAGDARLLVARLHPLGQPAQAAVAVQRVGAQRPRRQSGKSGPTAQGLRTLGPLGKQNFRTLASLGVSGMRTG